MKQVFIIGVMTLFALCFAGCADSKTQNSNEASTENTMIAELEEAMLPLEEITIPDKTIIAFGEATHGNWEFTLLKQTLFALAVEQQGIRAFALEADFGGCAKVNAYINGGDGTAQEAATQIGFQLYSTQEMAEVLQWMRNYNETSAEDDKIRFYGFDIQKYDNKKDELFSYLNQVDPSLAQEYELLLEPLNDAHSYDQEPTLIQQGLDHMTNLVNTMDEKRETYLENSSLQEYEFACLYATCIIKNAELQLTDPAKYSEVRDQNMADMVSWILNYEEQNFGTDAIFIAGHTAHMDKTSQYSSSGAPVLGEYLFQQYGDEYFVIGSECYESNFLAWDYTDYEAEERSEFHIVANDETRLISVFNQTEWDEAYLAFDGVAKDSQLGVLLSTPQGITLIGDSFSKEAEEAAQETDQTLHMVPSEAFDAIILLKNTTPPTDIPR